MKLSLLLCSLAGAACFVVACANGAANGVTDDVSFTEGDAGHDAASSTKLPPGRSEGPGANDASSLDDAGANDAATGADATTTVDAGLDAAPDSAVVSGPCGAGSVQLGEYATWYGKVNVHRATGGTWLVDSDCSSGADINTVAYCQKLWPATATQVQLAAVSADAKPFTSGGGVSPACGGVALAPGQAQFACCAP